MHQRIKGDLSGTVEILSGSYVTGIELNAPLDQMQTAAPRRSHTPSRVIDWPSRPGNHRVNLIVQRVGTVNAIKVAIIEDRQEFRDTLAFLIGSLPGFACVAACTGADEALAQLPAAQPEVILLDIDLGAETTGIDLIAPLKRALPSAEILMLTALDRDELIFRAVRLGASGYLRRNTPRKKLLSAIRDVYEGGSAFSPDISRLILQTFQTPAPDDRELDKLSQREEEILGYLAQGYVPKETMSLLRFANLAGEAFDFDGDALTHLAQTEL